MFMYIKGVYMLVDIYIHIYTYIYILRKRGKNFIIFVKYLLSHWVLCIKQL